MSFTSRNNTDNSPPILKPSHLTTDEENLETGERLFRVFVENVKDYAIIFLDPQGFVRTWNEGARKFKGYEKSEIIGKHYSCFYTPEDIAANHSAESLNSAFEKGFKVKAFSIKRPHFRFKGKTREILNRRDS